MSEKQPEAPDALRLAEIIEQFGGASAYQAAAELRRLHAECEALSSRCDRLDADLDDCRDKRDALHAECEALLSCVKQWRDLYRRAFSEACWATGSSNLFVIASEALTLDASRSAKEQP